MSVYMSEHFMTRSVKQNKTKRYGRNSLTESNSVCEVLLLKDNRINACAYIHIHTRQSPAVQYPHILSFSLCVYISFLSNTPRLFPRFLKTKMMCTNFARFFFLVFSLVFINLSISNESQSKQFSY